MTRKVYKSAMGKSVDIGALMLQNEQVRAVGNMNVNARGDVLDSQNRVLETRNRQAQRQYRRQSTNASNLPISTSTVSAKKRQEKEPVITDSFDDLPDDDIDLDLPISSSKDVTQSSVAPARGGLAAAIARSREVKQELEKTARQRAQEQGIKKI